CGQVDSSNQTNIYGTCSVDSDPRYTTFDGVNFRFVGPCTYVLAKVCDNSELLPTFVVEAQNEKRGDSSISSIQRVNVNIQGLRVSMLKRDRHRVMVNGIWKSLPVSLSRDAITIVRNRSLVLLETNFGLMVSYSRRGAVKVTVPDVYSNKLCGMCGNFNHIPDDDYARPNGSQSEDAQVLGLSWTSPDAPCDAPVLPRECPAEEELEYASEVHCGVLLSQDGPFAACLNELSTEKFHRNCVYDMCASHGDQEILCDSLQIFAETCQKAGIILPAWRNSSLCPLVCGENSHYNACASGCPESCSALDAPEVCGTCEERCECDDGFMLSAGRCVPAEDCGCWVDGQHYERGMTFMDTRCERTCECAGMGNVLCSATSCTANEICTVRDGVRGCFPSDPVTCHVYGDPHYVTFDGKAYSFRGTCNYTIAKTCGPSQVQFSITARNEGRDHTSSSFLNSVALEVQGFHIAIRRSKMVYVNGDLVNLPVTLNTSVTVFQKNPYVQVDTMFGLRVLFDGDSNLFVQVDERYRGETCGLCGTYSDSQFDDFVTPDGDTIADKYLFASSWNANDEEWSCSNGSPTDPECSPEVLNEARVECSSLYGDVFSACHFFVPPQIYVDSCVSDHCATEGDLVQLCTSLEAYEAACQMAEVDLGDWKNSTVCARLPPTDPPTTPPPPASCPLNCNFDRDECGWEQLVQDSFDWTRWSGSTPTDHSGPTGDHTTGSGHYMYTEGDGVYHGDSARMISPLCQAPGTHCLSFWYHMFGQATAMKLSVYLIEHETYTKIWTKSDNQGDLWHKAEVQVTAEGPFQVVFEGRRGTSEFSDVAIDDISLHRGLCSDLLPPVVHTTAQQPDLISTLPPEETVSQDAGLNSTSSSFVRQSRRPHPVCSIACDFENDICSWNQLLTDVFDWTRQQGSTPTPLTGPSTDHTSGSGHYLYIEGNEATNGDTARLLSSECPDPVPQCLEFWYHMYGSADTMGLTVYLLQGSLAQSVWSMRNNQGDLWHRALVDLRPEENFRIIFEGRRGTDDRSDVAVDDISLYRGTCAGKFPPSYKYHTTLHSQVQQQSDLHRQQSDLTHLLQQQTDLHRLQSDLKHLLQLQSDLYRPQSDLKLLLQLQSDLHRAQSDLKHLLQLQSDLHRLQLDQTDQLQLQSDLHRLQLDLKHQLQLQLDQQLNAQRGYHQPTHLLLYLPKQVSVYTYIEFGGHYMYTEGDGVYHGDSARMISPPCQAPGTHCLSFWYHMFGQAVDMKLSVYQVEHNTYTKIWTKSNNQGDLWHKVEVQITAEGPFQISVEGIRGSSALSDMAWDDVAITFGECKGSSIPDPGPTDPHPVCNLGCSFDHHLCAWSQMMTDSFDWTWQNGSTPTLMTGPSYDHTSGSGGYLYIEADGRYNGDTARLVSSECPDPVPQCLEFWYHMYGTADTMGLTVYLLQGSLAQSVWSMRNNQGDLWHRALVDLRPEENFQIIFEGRRGTDDRSDVAVDDISLYRGTCADIPPPGPATTTTVRPPQTTVRPGTPAPTTVRPPQTTVAPETPAPTTVRPETPAPTTVRPPQTTVRPETPAPTTVRPPQTTVAPETPAPTTVRPPQTTVRPETPAPTTVRPPQSTVAPETPASTTVRPPQTTVRPETPAPTTVRPPQTTVRPETPAPTTVRPPQTTVAPETPAPTTVSPPQTTVGPETPAPTTVKPPQTTVAPETPAPTTVRPPQTTVRPETPAPTTVRPPQTTVRPETPAPTTVRPPQTTVRPETPAPTTVKPPQTTVAPETPAPTTVRPPQTTVRPETPAPTTVRPPQTTAAPETPAPTTVRPPQTTVRPETPAPTTVRPPQTTAAPETPAPTTVRPPQTTVRPETSAPTTVRPPQTTVAPETPAPTTVRPPQTTVRPETPAPTTVRPPQTTVRPETSAPTTVRPPQTTVRPETPRPTPSCPRNSHYTDCMPACQPTCKHLHGQPDCNADEPCVQGCVCDDGFILKKRTCVPIRECGCQDDQGNKYYFDQVWYEDHCSRRCECEEEDGRGEIECDEEYECDDDDVCLMDEDGQFSCVSTDFSECSVDDDSEYRTFDDMKHEFEGEHSYVLVQTTRLPQNLPDVYVVGINKVVSDQDSDKDHDDDDDDDNSSSRSDEDSDEDDDSEEHGSRGRLREMKIRVYNHTVVFKKNRKVVVDGAQVRLPVSPSAGLKIREHSSRLYLTTDFGLTVEFNGKGKAEIVLPHTYKKKVGGLCGNFDGKKKNDMMKPDGEQAKSEKEFGESWRVTEERLFIRRKRSTLLRTITRA
ncbi:zonadhesin, partial [Chanos chanos]|uniref:Zonadhesin n=1 Tax=Chanos chanos TaxID=29144 RepID=A0A6J2V8W2_CHACN